MPNHPGMGEDLGERTRDVYADAENRLLDIIARQLADGLDAPGWAERKLAVVQQLRRSAQAVVDGLGKAVRLDVFDAVAEAYSIGYRATLAELGALSDCTRQLVDEITPNAQAVDRLAAGTVNRLTATHRSNLRVVVVSAAPRECPLCWPFEGKALPLTGPDAPGAVEVEHAIEDGHMVRVETAGSLEASRLAGLQHPNCRHSVSAYTPGITRTDQATSDPDGYEQGQRQLAIQRHIRKYKRRQAAAVTL